MHSGFLQRKSFERGIDPNSSTISTGDELWHRFNQADPIAAMPQIPRTASEIPHRSCLSKEAGDAVQDKQRAWIRFPGAPEDSKRRKDHCKGLRQKLGQGTWWPETKRWLGIKGPVKAIKD